MMHKNPEISIIVPVFNREKYLNQCIDSILEQTFTDFELILVDDGSSDNSACICKSYTEKDSRVNYIYQENKGVSVARNTGLDHAQGKYIGWVDSDDWVAPDMYEQLYNLLIASNADVAECRHYYVMQDKTVIHGFESHNEDSSDTSMLDFYIRHQLSESLCTKLFKRHLFENYRFPVGQVFEDMRCVLYLALNHPFYVRTSEAKYYYRHNENSIINSEYSINKAKTSILLLKDQLSYVNESSQLNHSLKERLEYSIKEASLTRYIEMQTKANWKNRKLYSKLYFRIINLSFQEIIYSTYLSKKLKVYLFISYIGLGKILFDIKNKYFKLIKNS